VNLVKSYLSFARGERRCSPWAASYPFGLMARSIVAVRNFSFNRGIASMIEPPLPVISVGNLTVGGTNKTPFVEMLCRMLRSADIPVGIVSRGYGGRTVDPVVVTSDVVARSRERGADALAELRDLVGDEPLLLASRLAGSPVAVSKDRLRDVDILVEQGVRVVVADDAFQHRRMVRDADICLVDACCPFGNGWLVPAGILREPPSGMARASMVVITKSDQVPPERLRALKAEIARHVPEERIFLSRLTFHAWQRWDGAWRDQSGQGPGPVLAFSAIGSPESFRWSLESLGVQILKEHRFKDHHRYRREDMELLEASMRDHGAEAMVCTEKDVYNLPAGWTPSADIFVPIVSTVLDEEERFKATLLGLLRPRIVVASNGYGEDSIGALLARKLRARFPAAAVSAFPVVGKGEHYLREGVPVDSVAADSPSGGVIKYDLSDLWRDIRSGLLRSISRQMEAWRALRGRIRTPLCVGDVYLLLHTLWGQGQTPILVATAKTVFLSGHWRLERFILRHRSRIVWTRDRETKEELLRSGTAARFDGNPIMDLTCDGSVEPHPWGDEGIPHVLLLPGSRPRAYDDVRLLLDAVDLLHEGRPCSYLMVVAPTLDRAEFLSACEGWSSLDEDGIWSIIKGEKRIPLFFGPLSAVTADADLLVGLGGTANQVCAGMGVPVVSIEEKGKFVQKKLLGGSELLVPPTAADLARGALRILSDDALRDTMSREGRERLGEPGALDRIVEYTARMGWEARCALFESLSAAWWPQEPQQSIVRR
jgi:tetraacyldisaccharide 4'-kinase